LDLQHYSGKIKIVTTTSIIAFMPGNGGDFRRYKISEIRQSIGQAVASAWRSGQGGQLIDDSSSSCMGLIQHQPVNFLQFGEYLPGYRPQFLAVAFDLPGADKCRYRDGFR
jgi:hypothetical protein